MTAPSACEHEVWDGNLMADRGYTAAQKATAGVVLTITGDGQLLPVPGVIKPEAKKAAVRAVLESSGIHAQQKAPH